MCYDGFLTLVEQRIVWAAQRGKQTWNRMKTRWERASSKSPKMDCRPVARDDFLKIRWGCNSWMRGRMIAFFVSLSSSDDSLLNECKNGIIAHQVREIQGRLNGHFSSFKIFSFWKLFLEMATKRSSLSKSHFNVVESCEKSIFMIFHHDRPPVPTHQNFWFSVKKFLWVPTHENFFFLVKIFSWPDHRYLNPNPPYISAGRPVGALGRQKK